MHHLRRAIALIAVTSLASTAEGLSRQSLRLSCATAPQDPAGHVAMPWDAPARLELGVYQGSGHALGIYTGAGLTCARRDDHDATGHEQRAGMFAEVGMSLACIPNLRLEVGVPVGAGLMRWTSEGMTSHRSGGYVECGAVARPIVAIGHAIMFLEVGYLASAAATAGFEGGSAVNGSGVFLALGLGITP